MTDPDDEPSPGGRTPPGEDAGPLPVEYPALDALAGLREVVETALYRIDRQLLVSL